MCSLCERFLTYFFVLFFTVLWRGKSLKSCWERRKLETFLLKHVFEAIEDIWQKRFKEKSLRLRCKEYAGVNHKFLRYLVICEKLTVSPPLKYEFGIQLVHPAELFRFHKNLEAVLESFISYRCDTLNLTEQTLSSLPDKTDRLSF